MLLVVLLVVILCGLSGGYTSISVHTASYSALKIEEIFSFEALIHMGLYAFVTDRNTNLVLTAVKKI